MECSQICKPSKKKRYTPNTKEQFEEPMYMIEVPKPSPIQQYRTSKRKGTPTGTTEINPKRQKYDVFRIY